MTDTLIERELQVVDKVKEDVRPDQKSISDIITHDNQILTFDMYRARRGNKGIWGRKIFFQSLINLQVIEIGKEGYRPTLVAQEKHREFFVNIDNTWGFNPDVEEDIEDFIHKPLSKMQIHLLNLDIEDKKERAQKKKEEEKRKQLATKKVEGLFDE